MCLLFYPKTWRSFLASPVAPRVQRGSLNRLLPAPPLHAEPALPLPVRSWLGLPRRTGLPGVSEPCRAARSRPCSLRTLCPWISLGLTRSPSSSGLCSNVSSPTKLIYCQKLATRTHLMAPYLPLGFIHPQSSRSKVRNDRGTWNRAWPMQCLADIYQAMN